MSKTSYKTAQIPIELIDENPDNKDIYGMEKLNELINSINEDGFTDPICVYDMENGRYEIFSGHKRYHAEKERNEKTISSLIFEKPKNNIERARRLIRSNLLNRDSNPITRAKELKYFYDNVIVPENKKGNKRLQLAQEFGMSESQVSKHMALLKLIPELQELAEDSSFPYSALSPAAQMSEEKQKQLYKMIKYKQDEEGNFHITRDNIYSYINELKNEDVVSEISVIHEAPEVKMMQYSNTEPVSLTPIMPPSGMEAVPLIPKSPVINRTFEGTYVEPIKTVHAPVQNIYIDYTISHVTQELIKVSSLNYSIEDKNLVLSNIVQLQKIISDIQSKL